MVTLPTLNGWATTINARPGAKLYSAPQKWAVREWENTKQPNDKALPRLPDNAGQGDRERKRTMTTHETETRGRRWQQRLVRPRNFSTAAFLWPANPRSPEYKAGVLRT